MRFAQAHKTTSYLMIAAAFGALISGGSLSPLAGLLGIAGLVTSWFWEPPRVRLERWALPWTIASLAVLALSVALAFASGDVLGTGANFLVWLVVVKAHNRRAAKDWQQLYLLSFLMLVAGSVLNTDLTYGVCFLVFVVAATWALILFHLRREMEDNFLLKHADDHSERVEVRRILESRRIVDRRFFVGTGFVSIGVFALSAVIFLAIPRVGVGFLWKSRNGLNLVGFSDGSRLGGHGRLKNDATVVMRVKVDDAYQGRDAPYIHWRGVSFDEYKDGAWSRSARAPRTSEQPSAPRRGRLRYFLDYDRDPETSAQIDGALAGAVHEDVWLEPLDADALFGASMPLAFEVDAPLGGARSRPADDKNDELRWEHGSTIHYEVWSQIDTPPPAKLRAADGELPQGYEVYLQIPSEITPRTRALARQITAKAATEYDKALAIQAWLVRNLSYSLDLEDPGAQEPIDFFLFDRKAGHCEYFASAFVILARAAGVPARDVNGFLGGEWNEYDDYIAVRAGDAHSWAEVYFPSLGWVTFDATPPSLVDELGRGGSGLFARIRRFFDTLRFHWTKWVVEYDLYQQLALFRTIGSWIKAGAQGTKAGLAYALRWSGRNWPLPLALAVIVAALLARRIRRRPGGLAIARTHRARGPIAAAYAAVVHRLARRGHPRDPAATPRELARDLAARGVPGAALLGELTELYYRAEWGGDAPEAAVARATELRRAIEAALREQPR